MLRGDRVRNLKEMYTTLVGPVGVMYLCAYCFKPITETELEVDHIYPHSRGGSDRLRNLVPACKRCNLKKLDKVEKKYMFLGVLNKVISKSLSVALFGLKTGVIVLAVALFLDRR